MTLEPLEAALLWLFFAVYSVSIFLVSKHVAEQDDKRQKPLFYLLLLNLVALYIAAIGAHLYLLFSSWQPDVRDLAAMYFFLVVGVFAVTIEIPGFILLSNYDDKTVQVLSDVRKNLVSIALSFDGSIQNLQSLQKANETRLREQYILEILDYFVRSCVRIKNIDTSLLNLTLSEVNLSIRKVSQQSKHPFPKLVDILSLTGLGFLIAQFLK